jgi:integrase/recombinase XerC
LASFIRFLEDNDCTESGQVAPVHVRSFLAHPQDLGRAPTTVNRGFGNIRAFFNWVVCEDYLAVSPCAKIKAPKVPQVIKPLISREQFEQILSLCPANTYTGVRRRAMYLFLRHSGVRVGELASLRLDDLDWERRRAKVYGKGAKERFAPYGKDGR